MLRGETEINRESERERERVTEGEREGDRWEEREGEREKHTERGSKKERQRTEKNRREQHNITHLCTHYFVAFGIEHRGGENFQRRQPVTDSGRSPTGGTFSLPLHRVDQTVVSTWLSSTPGVSVKRYSSAPKIACPVQTTSEFRPACI